MSGGLLRWIWKVSAIVPAMMLLAACAAPEATVTEPPAEPTATASPVPTPIPTFAGHTQGLFPTLENDGRFSTLVELIHAAAFADTLEHEGSFTFFAPSDAAFAGLPASTVDAWLDPANAQQTADLLSYHLVPQSLSAKALGELEGVDSALAGHKLLLRQRGDEMLVNNVRILIGDIPATNGVIHMIEYVLQPAP
jgi:uncharacterized surface protein with fasciclin (FAS1) repeats